MGLSQMTTKGGFINGQARRKGPLQLLPASGPGSGIDSKLPHISRPTILCTGPCNHCHGPAFAVITGSSKAVRHGIELDSYRADAAARVLDHVIQGDALSAHARVESFGLAYCNPPFDAEFGESGNQRFEVLFLSHFARWLVPGGVLLYVLPAQQLSGCAHVLASHFRDVQVFRLESPECVLYEQIVVFAIARSRRERDRTRDSEISFYRNRLASTARQYEMLPLLSERRVELRVPPTGPSEVSYAGLPFDTIEDLLPSSPAYRQVAQILDPQPILLSTRPVTPLHKGQNGLLSTEIRRA